MAFAVGFFCGNYFLFRFIVVENGMRKYIIQMRCIASLEHIQPFDFAQGIALKRRICINILYRRDSSLIWNTSNPSAPLRASPSRGEYVEIYCTDAIHRVSGTHPPRQASPDTPQEGKI
jgi:hypothetical protein